MMLEGQVKDCNLGVPEAFLGFVSHGCIRLSVLPVYIAEDFHYGLLNQFPSIILTSMYMYF